MKNLQVYLSPLASFKLDKLLEYLEDEWGTNTKNSFLKEITNTFDQLSSFPRSSPESQIMEGIHRCVVTRQTSLYYRIHSESLKL